MGQSPHPGAGSERRQSHARTAHTEDGLYWALVPQMVSSETVTLLCTAGLAVGAWLNGALSKCLRPSLSYMRGGDDLDSEGPPLLPV